MAAGNLQSFEKKLKAECNRVKLNLLNSVVSFVRKTMKNLHLAVQQ